MDLRYLIYNDGQHLFIAGRIGATDSLIFGSPTYGEAGSLFSGVAPLRAVPSCEVVDSREGEEFAAPGGGGGAKVGQFFGLGSRVT